MAGGYGKAELHRIVESTYSEHKRDILDFTIGHLNPKRLEASLFDKWTHKPWRGARMRKTENRFETITQSRGLADKILLDKIGQMKGSLLDFSLGTSSAIPTHSKDLKRTSVDHSAKPSLLQDPKNQDGLESQVLAEISKLMGNTGIISDTNVSQQSKTVAGKHVERYGRKLGNVFTEELKLPELMLPSVQEDNRVPLSLRDPVTVKQKVHQLTDKKFVTTHLAGITQKDRFKKILDFDRNILHRYETLDKRVRDGHKASEHLEQKLVVRLLELNEHAEQVYSVNFERLQVYDETWKDLSIDSTIFGQILSEIKTQYDLRLSHLLETMKSANHAELLKCLNTSEGISDYTEADMEEKRKSVEALEEEGRKTMLRNCELNEGIKREKMLIEEKKKRKEIEEKETRLLLPLKYLGKKPQSASQPPKKEINAKKRLQDLRVKIWEELDEIDRIKKDLKDNYVPKTLYKNVHHAVQDTENEMQKLMQQKEYMTKNMKVQKDLLQTDLAKFDSLRGQAFQDFLENLGAS